MHNTLDPNSTPNIHNQASRRQLLENLRNWESADPGEGPNAWRNDMYDHETYEQRQAPQPSNDCQSPLNNCQIAVK